MRSHHASAPPTLSESGSAESYSIGLVPYLLECVVGFAGRRRGRRCGGPTSKFWDPALCREKATPRGAQAGPTRSPRSGSARERIHHVGQRLSEALCADRCVTSGDRRGSAWLPRQPPGQGETRVQKRKGHDDPPFTDAMLRSMLLAALMTYSLASGLTLTLRSPDVAISALLQRLTGSYLHQLVQ